MLIRSYLNGHFSAEVTGKEGTLVIKSYITWKRGMFKKVPTGYFMSIEGQGNDLIVKFEDDYSRIKGFVLTVDRIHGGQTVDQALSKLPKGVEIM